MHCFIYAALTSAVNAASVLLTTPFVLCSTLYFPECVKTWDFYGLQMDKLLYMSGEGRMTATTTKFSWSHGSILQPILGGIR